MGEISFRSAKKNRDNNINLVFTNSAIDGIVNQRDFFDKDIANQNNLEGYYIVEKNDFIYNPRISTHAPVGPLNRNHLASGIMSPLYTVFSIKDKDVNLDFIERYFKTMRWHRYMNNIANYGARSDRMSITNSDFFKMPIPLPLNQEQEKIASFLTSVDTKIEQLTKKKTLIEKYKKGVMQKIFAQEIRFRDDDGSEYTEWVEKKLGSIAKINKGTQLNKDELTNTGEYPAINGGINPSGYTHEWNTEANTITISEGGNSCGYINLIKKRFWSGGHCYSIQELKNNVNNVYLYQVLKFNELNIMRLRVGSGLPNIQKGDINSFTIHMPTLKEQTKIANFLSSLDSKLLHVEQQLNSTKQFKKVLLQKMFV
ncbi:restriction endonuclease subunit S [Patescibacteria group bacterium]|nr:restriction endonuclease subunit S [Patescibacteria group bacterium]